MAQDQKAAVIILRMDTPGGLSSSMRDIIKTMLASQVPVIGFVAPSGARAASAGTYLLYASQLAVMAPGTNLGAATPINIMPMKQDKDKAGKKASTGEQKAVNDAKAYIRSLAQLHGRNIKWADDAVSKAASLSATEALHAKVINYMAKDIPDLLQKADGRKVKVLGKTQLLHTKNLAITTIKPSWQHQFLAIITNPSVSYILLMIGFYGLIFEFSHPGYIMPGVIGAICLLLALYAFQLLPLNYAGLALLLLGLAFLIAEAFLPSFGVLGLGGVVAFFFGSVMLFDKTGPAFAIVLPIIIAVTVTTAAFVLGVLYLAIQSRRRPVISGVHTLLGVVGTVFMNKNECWANVNGELWQVQCSAQLKEGDKVQVERVDGAILIVRIA